MALGKCQDCGHEMASSATECQNCGSTRRPVTKKQRVRERKVVKCHVCEGTGALSRILYKASNETVVGRLLSRDHGWYNYEYIVRPSHLQSETERILAYVIDRGKITSTEEIQCSECGGSGNREIVNYDTYEEEI